MNKHHVFEILIEEKDKPVINKRFVFTHSDPNILFTDFYIGIIHNDPDLENHKEMIQLWLASVFNEVKVNWFKTTRCYGWRAGIKMFYKYQPKVPFWIRFFSGYSWSFKTVIRKDTQE